MTQLPNRRSLAHVITGFDTGGTEMMTLRLVRHWSGTFRQNVLVLGDENGPLRDEFEAAVPGGVKALGLGSFGGLAALRSISATLRSHKPNAVLLNCFGRHHLVASLAARRAGLRAMGAWAGNPPPTQVSGRTRWAAVLAGSRLLGCPVATCSGAVMHAFESLGVGLPEGSRPIPNGVDVDEISARAASVRRNREAGGPVIGMVARLDAIKDHLTLIRAFACIRDTVPSSELWIIGEGSLRLRLEAEAALLGLADRVQFLGRRTDVPELLGHMDVYAFSTTRDEGFGIALIEAMAAGVPIVATDVPACREVLDDGAAGVLVQPNDPVALANAILNLINTRGDAKPLSEAAISRARSEYDVGACARRWEEMLRLDTKVVGGDQNGAGAHVS